MESLQSFLVLVLSESEYCNLSSEWELNKETVNREHYCLFSINFYFRMLLDGSKITKIVQSSHVLHAQFPLLLKSYLRLHCFMIFHSKQKRHWVAMVK